MPHRLFLLPFIALLAVIGCASGPDPTQAIDAFLKSSGHQELRVAKTQCDYFEIGGCFVTIADVKDPAVTFVVSWQPDQKKGPAGGLTAREIDTYERVTRENVAEGRSLETALHSEGITNVRADASVAAVDQETGVVETSSSATLCISQSLTNENRSRTMSGLRDALSSWSSRGAKRLPIDVDVAFTVPGEPVPEPSAAHTSMCGERYTIDDVAFTPKMTADELSRRLGTSFSYDEYLGPELMPAAYALVRGKHLPAGEKWYVEPTWSHPSMLSPDDVNVLRAFTNYCTTKQRDGNTDACRRVAGGIELTLHLDTKRVSGARLVAGDVKTVIPAQPR